MGTNPINLPSSGNHSMGESPKFEKRDPCCDDLNRSATANGDLKEILKEANDKKLPFHFFYSRGAQKLTEVFGRKGGMMSELSDDDIEALNVLVDAMMETLEEAVEKKHQGKLEPIEHYTMRLRLKLLKEMKDITNKFLRGRQAIIEVLIKKQI